MPHTQHGSLLGVTFSLLLSVSPDMGIAGAAVVLGAILAAILGGVRAKDGDIWLTVTSHGALATAIVGMSFMKNPTLDLNSFLLGDILAIQPHTIVWIWGVSLAVTLTIWALWRPLLAMCCSWHLALLDGIPVRQIQYGFMMLTALSVGLGIKIVGALLMGALLILPATMASLIAGTPVSMVIVSIISSGLMVVLGIGASWNLDTPTGPTIVMVGVGLLAVGYNLQRWALRR